MSCPGQLKISQGKKDQLHTLNKIIDSECRLLTFQTPDQQRWWDPSRTRPAWTNNTIRIRGGYQRCWFQIEVQFILQMPLNSICIMILRIQLKLNTALLSTVRSYVRPDVTGVTSHISHIYKGINVMLIIRGPIKPYTF